MKVLPERRIAMTEEIIHIDSRDGRHVVSARELYEKLGLNSTNYAKWVKKNILSNPYLIEKEDHAIFFLKTNNRGRPSQDIALTFTSTNYSAINTD